jgi:hypothetical protein
MRGSIKLNFEDDFDFDCVAITSVESDFKIAYHLNKLLNLNFIKQNDIFHPLLNPDDKPTATFSFFLYKDELKHRVYQLIQNKTTTDIYLKKQKNADYLLLIKGQKFKPEEIQELSKNIKTISGIVLTYIVNIAEEKDRDLLLI